MLLREFGNSDPLRVGLVAVSSQIMARIKDTGSKTRITTDAFIELLRKNNISLSVNDLYDLIEAEPLKNIIDSVNSTHVVFKGQKKNTEPTDDKEAEKQLDTVGKMASRASKK